MSTKHLLVISSPSGGGKSTIAKFLLNHFKNLKLSVSATTRNIREGEINGIQYHFLDKDEFRTGIENGDFVEYEEIFGNYYGTPIAEITNALANNQCLLFDVDVNGAMNIRNKYPDESFLLFISPPDLTTLEQRLRSRNTETEDQITKRLSRADLEMSYSDKFDMIIVNDNLDESIKTAVKIVKKNLEVIENE